MINAKNIFSLKDPSDLEKEIARLFRIADDCVPGTARYDEITDQIAKLYKLKEVDSKSAVSKDVLVGAVANLVGIGMIINYEYLHMINSKALGFIGRKITG